MTYALTTADKKKVKAFKAEMDNATTGIVSQGRGKFTSIHEWGMANDLHGPETNEDRRTAFLKAVWPNSAPERSRAKTVLLVADRFPAIAKVIYDVTPVTTGGKTINYVQALVKACGINAKSPKKAISVPWAKGVCQAVMKVTPAEVKAREEYTKLSAGDKRLVQRAKYRETLAKWLTNHFDTEGGTAVLLAFDAAGAKPVKATTTTTTATPGIESGVDIGSLLQTVQKQQQQMQALLDSK